MSSHLTPKQSSKDPAKDLASLVAALRSSKTKLDIDYDEFMKLDGAPTKQAAQMRIYRLDKSLGLEITGGGGGGRSKATTSPATPKTARKKSATAKCKRDEEESEEDELQESCSTKIKSEKIASQMTDQDDNAADRNGD